MTALGDALKKKYRSPQEALEKLGLDANLLKVENLMTKPTRLAALTLGLTAAHCAPLLAMDKQLELPKALFAELTSKNFKDKKVALLAGVRLALDGKLRKGLALDASTGGLAKLLDALEGTAEGNDESVSEEQHKAMEAAANGKSDLGIPQAVGKEFADKDEGKKTFDAEPAKAWMREKGATDEEISSMFPPQAATDEDPEEKKKREEEEEKKKAADAKTAKDNAMKDMKPAMDAAIETAVAAERKRAQGVRVAMTDVKPWIGDVPVTMALDSAEAVYRHALTALGVDGAGSLPEAALWPVLKVQPKPGAVPAPVTPKLGMDAAAREGLKARLGGIDLDRIGRA